jgi:hypothetical protein
MGSFDLVFFDALVSTGIAPERARAVIDGLARDIDNRFAVHAQAIGTKRDLAELEMRMNERFASIDLRFAAIDTRFQALDTRFQAVETRFQGIETKIAEVRSDIVRWMLTALTAQTALLLGALKLL